MYMQKGIKNNRMNKFICIMFAWLIGVGTVFAEGGKNQGETGTGDRSAGEDAQGKADQDQPGRGGSFWVF